ncbi:hypothetical protein GIB67_034909, partial [Kingdonia uniflora]
MYYERLRSSWEELSHYDSFIEWPASAPSEKVPIPPIATKIYAKIEEKTQVFQFLAGLNPDFEYTRVHLLNRTPFPTLEEAHAYCLSDQSRRLPMPSISGIPSGTSAMAVRYAYPAPPSVPSQTLHTSSLRLSPLPAASSNSRPPRNKYDYCGKWGHLKTTCHALHGRRAGYQPAYLSPQHTYLPTLVHQILWPLVLSFMIKSTGSNNFSLSSTPAASHAGNFASANSISASPTLPWIVDSGATDNMTGKSSLFRSYASSLWRGTVRFTNGTETPIVGKGCIPITDSLSLPD